MTDLLDQYRRRRVDGLVAGMYAGAERIKRQELDTAFSKLDQHGHLTDEQRADIEALADSLVSQLLAPPTSRLREAAANGDWETVATTIELFDPDEHERDRPVVSPPFDLSSGSVQTADSGTDTRCEK